MSNLSPAAARNLWIAAMIATSSLATLVLACATPYPALAALAALHARRAEGMALIAAAWVAAHLSGFGLLHYPLNATNVAWAVAVGVAAIASLAAARWTASAISERNYFARLSVSYVAAYVGFKAAVLLGVVLLDNGWGAFSPEILMRQFVRYSLILAGLLVFHRALKVVGVDSVGRPAQA